MRRLPARSAHVLYERSNRHCPCRRTVLAMEKELAILREENQWLRDSARFFAELSERLNSRLREDSEVPYSRDKDEPPLAATSGRAFGARS